MHDLPLGPKQQPTALDHGILSCVAVEIDIMTNLLEIEPLVTQTSAECTQAFKNGWLSCYPWPMRVVHDQGSEFMGAPFQDLLSRVGVKSVSMTACNPQGNSVIEAIHKSMGQVL